MIPLHVFTFFEMKPLRVLRVLEVRKLIFRVICKMLFVVIIHSLTFSLPSVKAESIIFFAFIISSHEIKTHVLNFSMSNHNSNHCFKFRSNIHINYIDMKGYVNTASSFYIQINGTMVN